MPGAYLGGGARGARAPPSASSPVLINSILGTTGSTAGLINGCSTIDSRGFYLSTF